MRRRSVIAFLATLAALSGLAVAAAPSAFAGSLQPLQCSLILAKNGTPGGGAASCPERYHIYLNAGRYRMASELLTNRGALVNGSYTYIDKQYSAGYYNWKCTVYQGGPKSTGSADYQVYCQMFQWLPPQNDGSSVGGTIEVNGIFHIPTDRVSYQIYGQFYSV